MKLDLKALPDAKLAELIVAAMAEWQRRLPTTETQTVTASARTVVVLHEPNAEDQDFCLGIIQQLREGKFAYASERARYKEIAKQFPDWISSKRWPDDVGGGTGKRWAESARAIDRAKGRLR